MSVRALSIQHIDSMWEAFEKDKNYLCQVFPWMSGIKNRFEIGAYVLSTLNDLSQRSFVIHEGSLFLGVLQLKNIQNQQAEVGYFLVKSAQGKGHATRALKDVCCLSKKRFTRLVARTAEGNTKSQAVLSRCGFEEQGDLYVLNLKD